VCVCVHLTILYNILATTVLITGSGLKGWEGWRSAISTRAGSKIPMIVVRWTRTPFHCRSADDDEVWPKGVDRRREVYAFTGGETGQSLLSRYYYIIIQRLSLIQIIRLRLLLFSSIVRRARPTVIRLGEVVWAQKL